MDYIHSFAGGRPLPRVKSLFDLSNLSPVVQQHLQQVYLTLALAVAIAAGGVYISSLFGQLGQLLGAVAFMICVPWLAWSANTPANLRKRRLLFAGAALSQGLLLAPLVRYAVALHPGVLVTALGGTAGVFACFSAAALLSPRRSYLFLGGMLASVMTTFFWMRFASWMFGGSGGALLYQAELYLGLAAFSGYVVYDTQVIVERCEGGDRDVLRHALDLFVDVAAIFVRLLVILLRNAQDKQQRREVDEDPQQRRQRRDGRTTRL